jgi:hypothetical protein
MSKLLPCIAAAAVLWAAPVAFAQTTPQPPAASTAGIKLTLEQRHVIRELIKDLKVESSKIAAAPAVGDELPQGASLQPMPNEIGRKVPQIKSHRFLIVDDRMVIVDPSDNKVAEVVELKAN